MAPTPPTLPNGRPIKEKIGVYGPPGVGKTHQFFNIARWHQNLDSPARFYAICTDQSYEVLWSNPEFQDLTNIEWEDVTDFQEYIDAAKKYKQKMTSVDWLSVDLQGQAWNAVQDEYARVLSKSSGGDIEDMGDLWIAEGDTTKYPIAGWNWQMPNARYRVFANNYLMTVPGHLFLVYGQAELLRPSANMKEDEINKKARELFKHIGYKPTGQKEDPFRFHTFLHLDGAGDKRQKWSTAKERWGNRERLGRKMQNGMVQDVPFEDFFMDYLVNVAGWKMG